MAHFSNYDTFICILSLITYIADTVTDVLLIIFFFIEGYAFFGSLSLCFVAVAALVMQVFSFHWHVTDRNLTWKNFTIHILFLAPLHRYIAVLRQGFKSRSTEDPEDLGAAYRGLNDISILRLVETFFESAPQLVLQLYIITSDLRSVEPLVGISCLFSFLSVAWAVTAYTDAQHLAYKKLYKRSTLSLIAHTTWQTGMIASRVCAIVLFMTVFHSLVAIPLALHAVAMMVWIAIIKPEFGSNSCEKGLFIFAAAIIHVFCFLNMKDGKSRWRMLFYYTVCFVENAVLVCLWYSFNDTNQPSWLNPAGFTAVFGGFMIGALSLFVYYCCCHPSGPAPLREDEKPTTLQRSQPTFNQKEATANKLQPVFNVSNNSAAFINLWLSASLDLTKEGLVQDPNNYLDTDLHTSHEGEVDYKKYGYQGNHRDDYNSTGGHDSCVIKESVNRGNNTSLASRNETRNRTLDRSDFSGYNASNAEQYSLPSYNIIEMFSQCKQDPTSSSFNSTLSLNKSVENTLTYDSNYYSGTYGERSSSREQQKSYLSSKPSSRQRQNDNSPVILENMEFSPIQISPLDPYKLLEETQSRNMTRSNEGLDYYQMGSNDAVNSNNMESTPIFHIKPDAARGITRLSLSYSALNTEDGVCPQSVYRKCFDYSSEASSFLQSRHKDNSPLYANYALRKSEELTFSNMSLPLPDGSHPNNRRRSTQSIEHHPSQDSLDRTRLSGNARPTTRKISPLSSVIKNRSVDSFYTTSPVGLSTSDRKLSLSGSTTDRSHRSLTSSGFQSEESNFSSPSYGVHAHTQFQSTPILENEISIIKEAPSTLRVQKHRESLDSDVFATSPHVDNSTPMIVNSAKALLRDKRGPFPSALMYSDSLEQIESPTLPPLTVSGRRSSSSGSGSRFFKDLTDNGSQGEESSDSSVTCSKSLDSSRRTRYSTNNEQSSLSALLSDGISSSSRNVHSSDGTISVTSESEKDGLSLPYIPVENYEQPQRRKGSDLAVKFYENIENFPNNTDREICDKMDERLQSHTHSAEPLYVNDMYSSPNCTDQPCESRIRAYSDEHQSPCQDERKGHSIKQNLSVEEDSPDRLGQNVDLFNRDKWRSSLDKESQERFAIDIEKLAPKKLYQLCAKNNANTKKRLSPVSISEYNDSPYKFRRPTDNPSDYVNIDNVSPASLGSAYEHMHTLTPGVYTDYENVYNLNKLKTNKCPIVRPESLSDSILLDEQSVNCNMCPSIDTVVSEPCSSHLRTVRSPLTSLDRRGVNSPINTSGVNSAFRPVKPKGCVDNQTYTFNGSGNSTNSVFSDSSSSIKSLGSNVPLVDGISDYENKSGSQSMSQSTTSSINKSRPIHSRESSDDSLFPWSAISDSRAPSFDVTGLTPVNYLKLAGRAPLSFSVSSSLMDDRSSRCSSHSYSNSIPWEDSENISSSNQSTQERSGSIRQPLRSLENTPVFSPIYGMDDNTRDLELASRKRFMSTPKLSTGSDIQLSKTPTGSSLNPHTPRRRVSSGYKNKTFSNDTSTWSSQSVSGQEWALEANERSSLSKTTYI